MPRGPDKSPHAPSWCLGRRPRWSPYPPRVTGHARGRVIPRRGRPGGGALSTSRVHALLSAYAPLEVYFDTSAAPLHPRPSRGAGVGAVECIRGGADITSPGLATLHSQVGAHPFGHLGPVPLPAAGRMIILKGVSQSGTPGLIPVALIVSALLHSGGLPPGSAPPTLQL